MDLVRERPGGVPTEAWWSDDDQEWVAGARDAAGELHGLVRYWRPDGTLVSECPHDAGKPHGEAKRFHESGEVSQLARYVAGVMHGTRVWLSSYAPTTEKMHTARMSKTIARAEADYEAGVVVAFRYFDRDGHPVAIDGTPLPDRPAGVPAEAAVDRGGDWVAGKWTEAGAPVGTIRRWDPHGELIAEEDHDDRGVRVVGYHPGATRRVRFAMRGGALDGVAEAWRRDGSALRRASFASDSHAGPVEDFDRAGAVVRRASYGDEQVAEPPPIPPIDGGVLDTIAAGEDGVVTGALSPIGMAHAIARGWGGGGDRNARAARAFRRYVKRVASPSLTQRLAVHGLDRAPRISTAARMGRVARALAGEPSVDEVALVGALVDTGATGVALGLSTSRAPAMLRSRIHDRRLDLSHLGLEQLPAAIGRFPGLTSIDASYNRLHDLPVEIADGFRLAKLDLSRNRIGALPRELAWLPELRVLHLSYNELTEVPSAVFALDELTSLTLGDNPLSVLPDAIGDLAALRSLHLDDTRLAELPHGLTRLHALTFLHLGDHPWAEPPAVLGELASLEELWLASRHLERLPEAICRLPRLRRLHVWYSALTEVPAALFECTQLVELRIRDNPLPDGTVERLREALPQCTIY
jgi:antitoxin component YwqK of YwqJK toxin-antitoxin module